MHKTFHHEKHSQATNIVRDIIIGMSDGLTVPFALAAGLTGAITTSQIIITAGIAEIIAGSISMGLGGYLATQSEVEHYDSERKREELEIKNVPDIEASEVTEALMNYNLSQKEISPILKTFKKKPKVWIDFMMRNELKLEKPNPNRALISALTISTAYIIGGIIPLSPYYFISNARVAVIPSAIFTLISLMLFGFLKGKAIGTNPYKSALQTMIIGGIAAGAAFWLAHLV